MDFIDFNLTFYSIYSNFLFPSILASSVANQYNSKPVLAGKLDFTYQSKT
jgi:hypothetical protein